MDEGIIVLLVFISLAVLGIAIGIGYQFGLVAESKGYNKGNWMAACILLGAPVWLLVIALPNKTQHNELLSALQQIGTKNAAAKTSTATQPDELPEL